MVVSNGVGSLIMFNISYILLPSEVEVNYISHIG